MIDNTETIESKKRYKQLNDTMGILLPYFPNMANFGVIQIHDTCENFKYFTDEYCDLSVCFLESGDIHLLYALFDDKEMKRYNEKHNTNSSLIEVLAHEMLHLTRGDSTHDLEFQTELFDIMEEIHNAK